MYRRGCSHLGSEAPQFDATSKRDRVPSATEPKTHAMRPLIAFAMMDS